MIYKHKLNNFFKKKLFRKFFKKYFLLLCSDNYYFNKVRLLHSEVFTFVFLIIVIICNYFWFDLINSYILSLIITIFIASAKQFLIDKFLFKLKPSPIEFIMSIKFPLIITFVAYYI